MCQGLRKGEAYMEIADESVKVGNGEQGIERDRKAGDKMQRQVPVAGI